MTAVMRALPDVQAMRARHWTIWHEAWKADKGRPQRRLRGAERDFLPAAIEVMEHPVSPRGCTKLVQPLEIGVVRAIHVDDGDRVKAGQPLIDLDPTDAAADFDRLEHERIARTLDIAWLDSLLGGGPGKQIDIGSGMAADAEIIIGNRRVIEYALSPILRYRHEAGRGR